MFETNGWCGGGDDEKVVGLLRDRKTSELLVTEKEQV